MLEPASGKAKGDNDFGGKFVTVTNSDCREDLREEKTSLPSLKNQGVSFHECNEIYLAVSLIAANVVLSADLPARLGKANTGKKLQTSNSDTYEGYNQQIVKIGGKLCVRLLPVFILTPNLRHRGIKNLRSMQQRRAIMAEHCRSKLYCAIPCDS